MATNVTFEFHTEGPDGRGGVQSAVVSLNDVVVNSAPNATGGWTTATVTADKQRAINLSTTDAATAGLPAGWYDKTGALTFKRTPKRS